ncbi:ladderlectin-like [Eucyclogobius newberryi]|uniref:ladderlectin-like n=1 Tax=Eucyclogobius newberryi TaxID=166745 RepID=UPI003B5A79E4
MKNVVVFLLFAAVALKATAAPAEEAPVQKVEVQEEPKPAAPAEMTLVQMEEVQQEPKPEVVENLPDLSPEVHSQYCFPGWTFYRGSCYFLNIYSRTWRDAVSNCAAFEATLAAVHSPLEYNHFQYMVGTAGYSSAWIGGFHFESSWRWHDGSLFDYNNFKSGGSGSTHKCLRMDTQAGQGWYSYPCSYGAPSICQMKVHC